MLTEVTKMFVYISIGCNWDLSLSRLRHTITNKEKKIGKIKKFYQNLREYGSEDVKQ